MDDFIHRVRNGNLKGYGHDRNRNDRHRPKGGPKGSGQRRTGTDPWPMIKKHLEKIGDSHKRLADAEERKAKCEKRKADAMECIADYLGQLLKSSSGNKPKEVPDIRSQN